MESDYETYSADRDPVTDKLPSNLERMMLMYDWILVDTPHHPVLHEIWDQMDGEEDSLVEEDLLKLEEQIVNDFWEKAELERFDFFSSDSDETYEIKHRILIQAVILLIVSEEEGDDFGDQLNELLDKAQEIQDKLDQDFYEGSEYAEKELSEREAVFLSQYFPEVLEELREG